MTHRQCRSMFVEALYGEVTDAARPEFNEHLSSCTECSSEYRDLASVARTLRLRQRPERTPQEWVAFWNGLAVRIEREKSPAPAGQRMFPTVSFWQRPSFRFAVAAVACLALGIIIGRVGWGPEQTVSETTVEDAIPPAERVALRQEALDYLDRSKVLLLGIVNAETGTSDDVRLMKPQSRSRQLVNEGEVLRARLNEAEFQRLSALVGDLEVLLLEIANLQVENNFPGLEIIRDGVRRKGVLLKINLEQMRAGAEQHAPAAPPASPRTKSSIS